MGCCGCGCGNRTNKTLENLQAAFNGESNASAKYAAYSEKAAADGYLAVAALFAAASRAEKIHAGRHAKVIEALGATPCANIGTYAGKDICEMLKDAIAGETEEFTKMYPAFIAEAKAAAQVKAVASFEGAMEAEKVHAKLYQEALDNLDDWKAKKDFFICPVCGWTEAYGVANPCPICRVAADKFLKF